MKLYSYLIVCLYALLSMGFCIVSQTDNITFKLKGTNGAWITQQSFKQDKGLIVIFTCNKCPMAKMYTKRINKLYSKYEALGVSLIAVNAMDTLAYKEESFAEMKRNSVKNHFLFPYLQDKSQSLASQLKAEYTPQAFLLWHEHGKLTLKYKGAIDSNAGDEAEAIPYLAQAIDALLKGQEIKSKETVAFGCRIYYRNKPREMK